ncbi:MAG: AI-2E family transporter [Verrucomicrobiae bacterium]|nr:AI-2E family transporter [Verrucomicrobiae bacterium]
MSQPGEPFFGPRQKKLIGFTVSCLCVALLLGLAAALIQLLSLFVSTFSSMLWPLMAAGIFTLILRPYVRNFQKYFRLSPLRAVLFIYSAALILFALLLLYAIPEFFSQCAELITRLPAMREDALRILNHLRENSSVYVSEHRLNDLINTVSAGAQSLLSHFVSGLTSTGAQILGLFAHLTGLAIIPVYLFYFLKSTEEPLDHLDTLFPFLSPDLRQDVVYLIREFVGIIVSFFRGQFVLGFMTGILYAIGFSMSGLSAGLFIGLVVGLLNIVPYLGMFIGFLIIVPTAFLQDGGGLVLIAKCLITIGVTQMIVDWYLTPRIMGQQTGLHPVTIIISIFFWGIALDGILGMLLGIPLTAFFVTFWRLAERKYLRPSAAATTSNEPST